MNEATDYSDLLKRLDNPIAILDDRLSVQRAVIAECADAIRSLYARLAATEEYAEQIKKQLHGYTYLRKCGDCCGLFPEEDFVDGSSRCQACRDCSHSYLRSRVTELEGKLAASEAECERLRASRGGPTLEPLDVEAVEAMKALDYIEQQELHGAIRSKLSIIRSALAKFGVPSEQAAAACLHPDLKVYASTCVERGTTGNGTIGLTIRCTACEKQWTADVSAGCWALWPEFDHATAEQTTAGVSHHHNTRLDRVETRVSAAFAELNRHGWHIDRLENTVRATLKEFARHENPGRNPEWEKSEQPACERCAELEAKLEAIRAALETGGER